MLHVDKQRHSLDVTLLPPAKGGAAPAAGAPAPGALVLCRITSVGGAGGGVRVQLSARSTGRVALTDIHDAPVQQALAGLQPGQYCWAAVLGPDPAAAPSAGGRGGAATQLLLSLRPSAGGQCAAHEAAAPAAAGKGAPAVAAGPLAPEQLQQGQRVAGYVKSAGPAGVFVCLARNLDARVRWGWLEVSRAGGGGCCRCGSQEPPAAASKLHLTGALCPTSVSLLPAGSASWRTGLWRSRPRRSPRAPLWRDMC